MYVKRKIWASWSRLRRSDHLTPCDHSRHRHWAVQYNVIAVKTVRCYISFDSLLYVCDDSVFLNLSALHNLRISACRNLHNSWLTNNISHTFGRYSQICVQNKFNITNTHYVLYYDYSLSLSLSLPPRGLSPRANYTDRAAAVGRRS